MPPNPDTNTTYDRNSAIGWGCITDVYVNGASHTTSNGQVNLGTFLTAHQSLANYYTKGEVDSAFKTVNQNVTNAQTAANQANSNADGRVSKSGDTINGTLYLNGPLYFNSGATDSI